MFHSEWLAIMMSLLAWLVALPLLWRQQQLSIPYLVLLPLAFMAFIALQSQLIPAVNIENAQIAMLYMLWAVLLMGLVMVLIKQTDRSQVAVWFSSGLGAAAICSTVIEFYFRTHGTFGYWGYIGQANSYGDLLSLGLVSVLYLLAVKANWRTALLVTAAVIILGLSLTASRSVWLYWIAMLTLTYFLQRSSLKLLFAGLGLYIAFQVLWTLNVLPIANNITAGERFYQEASGAPVRLNEWGVAWQLFTENPWLGQGLGQFDWGYLQANHYIPELQSRIEHAHNLFLHLAAELGIFPVLLLIGFLAVWLKGVLKTVNEKRVSDKNNELPFYTWLLMLLAVLGIHSLLEYPLWYAPFLAIAVIALTLGETRYWQLQLSSVGAFAVAALVIVGTAIASVHEWHYFKIEQDLQGKITNRLFVDARVAVVQAPLLKPYVALVYSLLADVADENMRPSLTVLNNAAYHFMPNPMMAYQQALLQALNGENDKAKNTMQTALAAYPDEAKKIDKKWSGLSAADQKKVAFLHDMVASNLNHTEQKKTAFLQRYDKI